MSDRAEDSGLLHDEEVKRLIAEFKSGNERAWQRLIEVLSPEITKANLAPAQNPDWRETRRVYIQEALLQAVQNYDADRGPFWAFAQKHVRHVTKCKTEDIYFEKSEAVSRYSVRKAIRAWSDSFRLTHGRRPTMDEICQANAGWRDFLYSSDYMPPLSLNAPAGPGHDDSQSEHIEFIPDRPSEEPNPVKNSIVSVLRIWHTLCIGRLRAERPELVPVFEHRYGRYWLPDEDASFGGMTGWPETVDEAASELPQFSRERKLDFIIRERQMLEILVSAGLLASVEDP